MSERNWELEVEQNLQEFERRQASVWHNPSLARRYCERGIAVALVVVLTSYGSSLRGISQDGRNLFFACSIFGSMIAIAFISIGIGGLVNQRRQTPTRSPSENGPPPIGW